MAQQQSPSCCGERDELCAPRDRSQVSARRGIGCGWIASARGGMFLRLRSPTELMDLIYGKWWMLIFILDGKFNSVDPVGVLKTEPWTVKFLGKTTLTKKRLSRSPTCYIYAPVLINQCHFGIRPLARRRTERGASPPGRRGSADFANAISINYYQEAMHIYARDARVVLPLIAAEGRAGPQIKHSNVIHALSSPLD